MVILNDFVSGFINNFTLLGYFSFCLLVTFIVISLFSPCENISLRRTSATNISYKRLNNIDFLKILLTYTIVLHHEYQALKIPNNGGLCVELFFIISGFMLHYTYTSELSIREFIRKKIIYFLPYIFLGDILALCLFQNIQFASLFAGIFMYADTVLYNKFSVYAPTWYLVTLFWVMFFYFSMMKIFSKEICSFIIAVVAFITWSAMGDLKFILSANEHLPVLTNGQVRALACVSVGYFIALNYKPTEKTVPNFLYTILELGLLLGLYFTFFKRGYEIPIFLVVILFIFLFELFIYQKGYISAYLGKVNWLPFAKYMLPIFMTHWVITMLQQLGKLWGTYSIVLQIFLAFFCSTILGIISYHVVHWGFYFQRVHSKKFLLKEKK